MITERISLKKSETEAGLEALKFTTLSLPRAGPQWQ